MLIYSVVPENNYNCYHKPLVFTTLRQEVYQKLSDLIHENREYQYQITYYDGSKHDAVLESQPRY